MPFIEDKKQIKIMGIKFRPIQGIDYRFDYSRIAKDISEGKDGRGLLRSIIAKDLFFIVYFVMGNTSANREFVVNACREVGDGVKTNTLDVWAREHFKTSVISIAETLQAILVNPEITICLFAYARPVAKKMLFEIKSVFENSELLRICYPDVVWEKCDRDAPVWSLDDGLVLKRKGTRKEPTVMASGLVEGMPTGMHFDHMVFDDIVTEDIAQSAEVMEKVKLKFDSAMNLGTDGGTHRVLGTFYHYNDPLTYILNKKNVDGEKMYLYRKKPATDTGLANGKPVLLSEERFKLLSTTKTFNCQQLLDPTPFGAKKLDSGKLKTISRDELPDDLFRFMTIDPAGDSKNGRGDGWAMMVVGVSPNRDDAGASDVYVLDMVIEPMKFVDAIQESTRMYLRNGMILQLGVEKVGIATIEIHVAEALEKQGVTVSQARKNLTILTPAGRNKHIRIENALAWALLNGKIHVVDDIDYAYRERLVMEMDRFPHWHDDGLDALSYVYDIIHDSKFLFKYGGNHKPINPLSQQKLHLASDNGWMVA